MGGVKKSGVGCYQLFKRRAYIVHYSDCRFNSRSDMGFVVVLRTPRPSTMCSQRWLYAAAIAAMGVLLAVTPLCAQVVDRGDGTTTFETGGSFPLWTGEWVFEVPALEFEPTLELEVGFSSEEPEAFGAFLDSFSLTLQTTDGVSTAVLVTMDPTGAVWAPETPGGVAVDLLDLNTLEAVIYDLDPVFPYTLSFSVSYSLPDTFADGGLTLYGDLFDNQNEWNSVAYVTSPRISRLPAVDVSAFADDLTLLLSRSGVGLLTVTNAGPDVATTVVVSGVSGAGAGVLAGAGSSGLWVAGTNGWIWEVGVLPAGGSAQLELTLAGEVEGEWTQAISVQADELETSYSNNTFVWSGEVLPLTGLELALVGDSQRVLEEEWTDGIVVTNGGPSAATGVRLQGVVPAGLRLLSDGVTVRGDGTWELDLGDIAVGQMETVELRWRALEAGSWTNAVELSGAESNVEGVRLLARWVVEVESPLEPFVRVESADRVDGEYLLESAAIVDGAAGLVRVREFGRASFYRLRSTPRARIADFAVVDSRRVELGYFYDPELFVVEGAVAPDGEWSEVSAVELRLEEQRVVVAKATAPPFLRIRSEAEVNSTGIAQEGDGFMRSFEIMGGEPVLESSSVPEGPYSEESGVGVDPVARRVVRLVDGGQRFYRLVSDRELRVTSMLKEGRDLLIYFE